MIVERPETGASGNRDGGMRGGVWLAYLAGFAGWAALLGSSIWWGWAIVEQLELAKTPPFIGTFRLVPPVRLLLPLVVGAVLIIALPVVARRWRWRPLLGVASLAAGGWAVSLAATMGYVGLVGPVESTREYGRTLPKVDGVLPFVRSFVEQLPTYTVHTKGHPPGPVLVLYALEQLGLPPLRAEAVLVIVAGSSAVAAVAITMRVVAGERAARTALPFLALTPMALWVATSMDAFFLGVSAWGVALLAMATELSVRRADLVSIVAGLLLGFALYLTYAMAPFGLVPLALLAARRRWRLLVPAGLGVAAVVAAFTASGFWWFAGMEATHSMWAAGIGPRRSYWYFLLANFGVLAFMVGPATGAALATLRDRRLWWLVGAILLVLVSSNLGGFERGEVERIWLPFAIWLIPATAALTGRTRGWLGVNVVLAVAFQAFVASPW